jgi:hypothetical protein
MALPKRPQQRHGERAGRRHRRGLSTLLHRLALLLALTVGGGALVYNALSIVSGEGGLVGLSSAVDLGPDGVPRRFRG